MRSVAVHNAIHIRQQHHNVVAANMQAARQRQNHMRILRADILVMQLSVHLLSALGVISGAPHMLLQRQGEHIRTRRKHEAQAIIEAIPRALVQLKYCGRRNAASEVHMAVRQHSVGRYLLVGIKFVPSGRARTQQDEAWITTAHFLRGAELRRLLRNGRLHPIRKELA